MNEYLFTSESVTEGHPDKVCDQVADAVLDAILTDDPNARVACECFCTTGSMVVMGEISTKSQVNIPAVARGVICDIGYDRPEAGFDGHTCAILTAIDEQSPDIALGVDRSLEQKDGDADPLNLHGAGDQGMMFGYACNETPEKMPLALSLSHALARRLAEVRKTGQMPCLRPDGKTQVTVAYQNGKPVGIHTVVLSAQHQPDISQPELGEQLMQQVLLPVLPAELLSERTRYYINPTGQFVVGGPSGDTGLTGRKIIVDTYGGAARHGGGSFSGKDPTKVDRTAAYAARWVAKNVVAAGLADRCEVQLAYAIGVAHPVSVLVETFGTGKVADESLSRAVAATFDLRPEAIIRAFDLRRPIYRPLAAYGHFGRPELQLPWEQTNRIDELTAAL